MRRATLPERAVAVLGMVAVWLLLWGNAGPFTIVGGVVVAILALMVFPLPLVPFGGRVSPLGVVLFTACFLRDLVLASAQVAWLAIRPGPPPASAIVAVPLRATSDLHITLTAAALSLIPGSLVVEADRDLAILYVHVIGVSSMADVDEARAAVVRLEDRILHATGVSARLPHDGDSVERTRDGAAPARTPEGSGLVETAAPAGSTSTKHHDQPVRAAERNIQVRRAAQTGTAVRADEEDHA
ncbi:Na+/H+ antiporter subunit E [Catenuloplanes japonicus]|uniref:Na+/H+ antiporter subunit E n=1 Tax=Catenuloplanes japonicus TaxID=33876 RepID=UPI000690D17B|nr:Na+/H+ antiporter subunit E [Catenuloplanes japonicus]